MSLPPQKPQTTDLEQCLSELRALLDDRLSTASDVRQLHGKDASFHEVHPPDAVAFVKSNEEVAEIVKCCVRYRIPIIPFGSILEEVDNAVYERSAQLEEHLRSANLFFPIDPGADASIGGMTATRASGTNAVRYGTMRENVLGLTVINAEGRILKTGTRSRKSSAGYDLTRLLVGSEGTLGIITEIQLRLHGIPEAISAAVCSFETLAGAVNTVISVMQSGLPVARVELLDEVQMDALNQYSNLDYPKKPTLFFEFNGTQRWVEEQSQLVGELAGKNGGGSFRWATDEAERVKLWDARHDAYYAAMALKPGCKGWPTDVCVPISRLAECILETRADIDASNLTVPIVGHVGDGNFHLLFLIDPANEAEDLKQFQQLNDRLIERALKMGGTCTGEHGVGIGKIHYMRAEHGESVEMMRQIKQALDPMNLFNPGKLVPA